MMKNLIIFRAIALIAMSFGFHGCKFVDNVSPERQKKLIHDASESAIVALLMNVYDDEHERLKKALEIRKVVNDRVFSLLANPNVSLDEVLAERLLEELPPENAIYFKNVFNLLSLYFETPKTNDMLSKSNLELVIALLSGIEEGCTLIVGVNNASN